MKNLPEHERINIIILAENRENAEAMAEKVSSTKVNESDLWHEHKNNMDFYTSLRWPNCIITSAPVGATDIIFIYLKEFKENFWEYVKNYVDERKDIPYKILVSDEDLSNYANQIDFQFLKLKELSSAKEKILKSALRQDIILRNVFNKIDSDGDGAIDEKEIIKLSNLLNHPLNDEDAREIVKLLSREGKIYYNKFKQWWIMGRSDFYSFRKLVQIEYYLNNFIKNSDEIDNYIKQKIDEGGFSIIKPKLAANFNIKPKKDFNSKTSINLHIVMGDEYNNIIESLPSKIIESPLSFGIEFYLHDNNDGPTVINDFDRIKTQLLKDSPLFKFLMNNGLRIDFRHVGNTVFVDFTSGDSFADYLEKSYFNKDYSFLKISGLLDLHFSSKLSLQNLLDFSLEKILSNLVLFKIEAKAEYTQNKICLAILNYLLLYIQKNKVLSNLFNLLSSMRFLNLSFDFDHYHLEDLIKFIIDDNNEKIKESNFNILGKNWENDFKASIVEQLRNYSNFFSQYISKRTMCYLYPENTSAYLCLPLLEIYAKTNFIINGIENVFNSFTKKYT